MRWTFDADAAALYTYIRQGRSARQAEIADGVVVDFDEAGVVLGVEFLSPCPPIPRAELEELGVDRVTLELMEYLVHTPLPRRGPGLMSAKSLMRNDQAVESNVDVRAEPIPA
jgi:uncharacterized protein YuzE